MKAKTILPVVLAGLIADGCANPGIVQISSNTYLLSREDHGGIFGSVSALKAGVFNDATAFAEKHGKAEIPVSAREHPVGIMGDWASFELTFRLTDKDAPEARSTYVMEQAGTNSPGKGTILRPDKYTEYEFKAVVQDSK
jgi:hypothetical protein